MSVELFTCTLRDGVAMIPRHRRGVHMGLGVNQRNLLVPAVHGHDAEGHVPHRRRLEPRHG